MTPLVSKSRSRRSRQRTRSTKTSKASTLRGKGPSLFLAFLMWLAALALLYSGRPAYYANLAPGQRAPATIVAAVDFECQDTVQTELDREQAAAGVPPVFRIDEAPLNQALRTMDKLFIKLDAIARAEPGEGDGETAQQLEDVLFLLELPLTPGEASVLGGPEALAIGEAAAQALKRIWYTGIISEDERGSRVGGLARAKRIQLHTRDDAPGRTISLDDLRRPAAAAHAAGRALAEALPDASIPLPIASRLFAAWTAPNLRYDDDATEVLRDVARRSVPPAMMLVRSGTTLTERGKEISPLQLEQVRAHEQLLNSLESTADRRLEIAGNGGMLLVALLLCTGLLKVVRPRTVNTPSVLLLLLVLSLLSLVPTKALLLLSANTRLIPPGLVEYILPLALAPLLASILTDRLIALVVGVWTALVASLLFGQNFTVLTLGLVSTVLAVLATKQVQHRSSLFKAGLYVGSGQVLLVLAHAALAQPAASILAMQVGGSLLNGLLVALVALVLLPLMETVFGMTTDIRLLEYSDPGSPLLQRLAKEAPGTYHHSLMVADLGRAAASEIGANAMLVRVCAYYHDIGKLTKPEFFSENQRYHRNPHDTLAPSMSTLVILAHVKEGVTLAQQYRLPAPIIQAIREHHGTGLISFFYQRARKLKEGRPAARKGEHSKEPSEGDFRYEGPRPSNREMGILMLADSIEAASRSMSKPTASKIKTLVEDIIESRIEDGQLDDCELTLSEIAAIRQSFIFTLTSMLHARIEYPTDENRAAESTSTGEPGPAEGDPAPAMAGATG